MENPQIFGRRQFDTCGFQCHDDCFGTVLVLFKIFHKTGLEASQSINDQATMLSKGIQQNSEEYNSSSRITTWNRKLNRNPTI